MRIALIMGLEKSGCSSLCCVIYDVALCSRSLVIVAGVSLIDIVGHRFLLFVKPSPKERKLIVRP